MACYYSLLWPKVASTQNVVASRNLLTKSLTFTLPRNVLFASGFTCSKLMPMKSMLRPWLLAVLLTGAFLWPAAAQTNYLRWHAGKNLVDASIESWTLIEMLENLATASGWEIYVEPAATHTVSSKFQQLNTSEALRRLLGDLSFALLPRTNSAPKLFIYSTTPQEATKLIKPGKKGEKPGADKLIPNELIVTLKPGSKKTIEELAKELGAKVIGRIEGTDTYRLQFEDEAATKVAQTALSENPDVASVDNNYTVDRPPKLEQLAYSSAPPLNLRPRVTGDPNHLIVGLIDTPVQTQGSNLKDFLLPGLSVASDPLTSPSSDISHGTSMAETILRGVAITDTSSAGTNVRILPVDIYGANESTTTFDVAKGIAAAIGKGATIINMSLGSEGTTSYLQQMIEDAHRQGAIFVGAAGNQPVMTPTYPAAYPEVVAVTAGDKSGNVASYANRGAFVDVMAPGANIVEFNNRAYMGQGTSFSSAYVSGVAAGLAATSGKALNQVEADVRQRLAYRPKTTP